MLSTINNFINDNIVNTKVIQTTIYNNPALSIEIFSKLQSDNNFKISYDDNVIINKDNYTLMNYLIDYCHKNKLDYKKPKFKDLNKDMLNKIAHYFICYLDFAKTYKDDNLGGITINQEFYNLINNVFNGKSDLVKEKAIMYFTREDINFKEKLLKLCLLKDENKDNNLNHIFDIVYNKKYNNIEIVRRLFEFSKGYLETIPASCRNINLIRNFVLFGLMSMVLI